MNLYLNQVTSCVKKKKRKSDNCRDPSPWETRGTRLMVTHGTCYQPDHHHPDSPTDMYGAAILSGTPPRKDKQRFSFSYSRKSKRRWQSVDTRIVSTNTSGYSA